MAKYIIEIEDDPFVSLDSPDMLWRAKGFKSLVFDRNGLQKLTPYREPCKPDKDFKEGDIVKWMDGRDKGVITSVYSKGDPLENTYKLFWSDCSATTEDYISMTNEMTKVGHTGDVRSTMNKWIDDLLESDID